MTIIHKSGNLRGDKINFKDGVGCCVWYPMPMSQPGEEEAGLCFDFPAEDIDDMIALLKILKEADAEVCVEGEEA